MPPSRKPKLSEYQPKGARKPGASREIIEISTDETLAEIAKSYAPQ